MNQEHEQCKQKETKRGISNPFVDIVLPVAAVGGLLSALVFSPKSSVVMWQSAPHSVPSDPVAVLPGEGVEVVPSSDGDKAASVESKPSAIVLDEEFTTLINGGMPARFRAIESRIEEMNRSSEALNREPSKLPSTDFQGTESNETPGNGGKK